MEIKDIIKKVKQIEIRTKRKSEAALMGQYHSALKGQGMTFSEVRTYQFGDEIRRIDWNKTARFQEPFVKIMEEERELTVMLVVDVSASMDYGTQVSLKREFVAEICASIGFSAVSNNDKVGLILFSDQIQKVIPPRKGRQHVLSIISQILTVEYKPCTSDLDGAMQYMMNVFKKKSFIFMFSDFEDGFSNKTLKVTAKKHALLAMRIYDDKDQQIPDIGYARFVDAETGKQFWANTSNSRWRYEFAEKQKQKLRQTQEVFENASAGFLNLKSGEAYAQKLLRYFQQK
ncbi:DUF58 domain-containing protein [Amniculibacterium sp. G2-70]|uniref:DUF58 domain-containing protein n=1 Tax=Amniculibacterium sp. G2-70 TaxID=2767188 RepID=UPI00165420B8|nr:DUF58 domain-containing protein [Amniculibacterium sp. G2-70]